MLRIRGTVGEVPVDLTVELDDSDWAKLGSALNGQSPMAQPEAVAGTPAAKPVNQDDALWQVARDLLRKAGQLSGPDLLEQLESLTGNAVSGKRLLVRLRHSSDVKVISGGDTPLYSWIG
ncbi:hypothetical protein HU727_014385 [Pseudomonas sp. SWRI153]|uniref:Uncharacterized protein n=1 Tax=Pseudomonas khorasanensis TaxID=2745508 RepID=A0A923F4E6_9PSED|nr:hypothetical protein [Pseudomonas khorasanensis]MBV4486783.1 hypothetical protein [Pseudomonas khorasanensis]